MKTNSHSENLNQSIALLTLQKREEWQGIKNEVTAIKEQLNPINLIKNAVGEVKHNLGENNEILKSIFSFGVGYLSSKISVGKSDSKFIKLVSSLVLMGVTKFIDKTPMLSK